LIIKPAKNKKKEIHGTLAVLGSSDCSISGWTSFSPRPIFLLKKPFQNSVLDISWSGDGKVFMASSYDGSVLYVKLDEKEIGKQLSTTQQTSYLTKSFGSDTNFIAEHPSHLQQISSSPNSNNLINNPSNPISHPSLLSRRINNNNTNKNNNNNNVHSSTNTLQNQKETIKDGKRRIKPQLVSQNNFDNASPSSFLSPQILSLQNNLTENQTQINNVNTFSSIPCSSNPSASFQFFHLSSPNFSQSNSQQNETIFPSNSNIEKQNENEENEKTNKTQNNQISSPLISTSLQNLVIEEKNEEKEEKEKDDEEDDSSSDSSSSESNISTIKSKKKTPQTKRAAEENSKKNPPPKKTKTKTNKNEKSSNKRKESLDSKKKSLTGESNKKKESVKKNKKDSSNNKKDSSNNKKNEKESSKKKSIKKSLPFIPKKILPYHNFEFVSPCLGNKNQVDQLSQVLKIEIVNSDSKFKVTATNNGRIFWNLEKEGNINCFSSNSQNICFVVEKEEKTHLSTFDHFGRILLPSFALEHNVHEITSSSHSSQVVVLCCDGTLFFWDFSKNLLLFSNNISHLISDQIKLDKMWIAPNSVLVICLSNGNSYTFSFDLSIWVRIDDLQFTKSSYFTSSSHKFRQENMNGKQDSPQFVLSKIQTDSFLLRDKIESFFSRGFNFDPKETLSHVEHQMASSLLVRSFVEYSQWSKIYIQKLTESEEKERIYFYCDSLLNALDSDQYKNHKKQLLKEILNLGLIKQYDISEFYRNLIK
jgi:hypothetical protein